MKLRSSIPRARSRARLLFAAATLGSGLHLVSCASRQTVETPLAACAIDGLRRWTIPASGERVLRVWMDAVVAEHGGWGSYGRRRLRAAMDEWNSLRLPVRFTAAASARDSDIVVHIIRNIPAPDDSTGQDQAALTNITYSQSGSLMRARVFIGITDPRGRPYTLDDQQANLIHELGHAIGLGHAREIGAVMAERRISYELTGADIALARAHYPRCRG